MAIGLGSLYSNFTLSSPVSHPHPCIWLTQTWLNNPMCVTWKGDLMAAGDAEGVLFFYDSKNSQARSVDGIFSPTHPHSPLSLHTHTHTHRTLETPRGALKKLRFAPGKGNTKMLVLYGTRLDVRDALGVSLFKSLLTLTSHIVLLAPQKRLLISSPLPLFISSSSLPL